MLKSSAEAEFRSRDACAAKITWLIGLYKELGVCVTTPVNMICDSKAAIQIAVNPIFHERTKHIERDCHCVRDAVKAGLISTRHVRTKDQLADILTKALGKPQFELLLSKLGVTNLHTPT